MASHTAAHYFLEGLVELGVEYLFSNFGTDHVSLIEALAEWDRAGRAHPRVVVCPHENIVVYSSDGYPPVPDSFPAVLAPDHAYTAFACIGMHNLFPGR